MKYKADHPHLYRAHLERAELAKAKEQEESELMLGTTKPTTTFDLLGLTRFSMQGLSYGEASFGNQQNKA